MHDLGVREEGWKLGNGVGWRGVGSRCCDANIPHHEVDGMHRWFIPQTISWTPTWLCSDNTENGIAILDLLLLLLGLRGPDMVHNDVVMSKVVMSWGSVWIGIPSSSSQSIPLNDTPRAVAYGRSQHLAQVHWRPKGDITDWFPRRWRPQP